MTRHFDRRLPDAALARLDRNLSEVAWFADLFSRWRPAGSKLDVAGRPKGLRLAIRNGYLNLYRYGQSVAKVSFDRDGVPRADTHQKYLQAGQAAQSYARLSGDTWSGLDGPRTYAAEDLDACITLVDDDYAGDEKRFVEAVIAENADVIDIEMGLPASSTGPRVAPRMDLVALEPDEGELRHATLVFWEAKLVRDGRMRRRGDELPKVVKQMRDYADWLARSEEGVTNAERVEQAYANCCKLMVELRNAALRAGCEIAELGPTIRASADGRTFAVDQRPRLLVDNREGDLTFQRDGHATKLEKQNPPILVQTITGESLRLKTFDDLRGALSWRLPA